ncbi:MAG: hypothetical protein ACI4KF_04335 [Huintestinicola sp.]
MEKNPLLRNSLILDSLLLLWAIPSCSIFGVISVITGWVAYSGTKKRFAKISGIFSILASLASIGMFVLTEIVLYDASLWKIAAVVSVIASVLYIVCGVMSFKGGSMIPDDKDTGGLFGE